MKLKENLKQLALYVIVGGLATVVEWAAFYIFNKMCAINYMIATALAFIISTFANWAFGKIILFKEKQNVLKELAKIYLTSIAGLLMNLLIMWIAVNLIGINEMISKIIATGIVFLWNFFIRKFLIYKV